MSEERVVLLDAEHRPVGTMAKAEVHGPDTPLHLAFSVYVFDGAGRFLATRRALGKRTWGGVWTNSCCGHPAPGETVQDAAARRLAEELSLDVRSLDVVLPDFSYRAVSPDGMVEHEVCPVLVARADRDPRPDPAEVVEWQWTDWSAFRSVAATAPWLLSPWSVLQVGRLPAGLDRPPAALAQGTRQ
jgi:isopentenyl-diphosphate delta-isomerase